MSISLISSSQGGGIGTYLSGRLGTLLLVFIFNILAVKLFSVTEYATFSLLLAGASVANTVAGLGSQRLVPKIIGSLETTGGLTVSIVLCKLLLTRAIALLIVSTALYYVYSGLSLSSVALGATYLLPFIALTLSSSIYLDLEAASQALARQRLSRLVTLLDSSFRCLGLLAVFGFTSVRSAHAIIYIVIIGQTFSSFWLLFSALSALREQATQVPNFGTYKKIPRLYQLAAAAYLGGLTWMVTAPPILRLVAATMLPPTAVAALGFVQSLGSSLQRYTPGFMLLPFVEAKVMRDGNRATLDHIRIWLSLPWKIDLIIALLAVAAVVPIAPFVISTLGTPSFSRYAEFLAFVLLPIPAGTMYRSMEVAAVYSDKIRPLALSAGISIVSILGLIMATTIGVTALLLIPVFDNILKCVFIQWRRNGLKVRPIREWILVISLFAGGIFVAIFSGRIYFHFPTYGFTASILCSVALLTVLYFSRLISEDEKSVIVARVPNRLQLLLRKINLSLGKD